MFADRLCPGCSVIHRGVCPACLAERSKPRTITDLVGVDQAIGLFDYDEAVQRIVVAGKNGARRDVLRQLGALLGDALDGHGIEADVVTWVPAGRAASRRRGYDQGRILAESVASGLGCASRRLLVRRGRHTQAGRGREERLVGPDLRAVGASPNKVLLLDDVITTGASLAAGARTLRQAGAHVVLVGAVAVAGRDRCPT